MLKCYTFSSTLSRHHAMLQVINYIESLSATLISHNIEECTHEDVLYNKQKYYVITFFYKVD